MSASSKKKLRNAEQAEKLTEKQLAEQKDAKQLKLYTTLAVVILVALVVFAAYTGISSAISSSGIRERNTVALTIGDNKISNAELNYYFIDSVNEFYNQYGTYAALVGLDVTKPLNEQILSGDDRMTWADDFLNRAIDDVTATYALVTEAKANGVTLPETTVTAVDSYMDTLEAYATAYGYPNVDTYLKSIYGNGATKKGLRNFYEMTALASYYQSYYQQSLTYTDEQLRAAEAEDVNKYSSYSYNYYYLNIYNFIEGEKDANSEYSAEQKAAAAEKAEEAAKTLINGNTTVEQFDAAIAALPFNADSPDSASFSSENTSYGSIFSGYADWMSDPARKAGDMTYVATSSTDSEGNTTPTGFYVVMFNSRNDNNYALANVRHILVSYEGGTYDSTTGVTTYSDEEKATAKAAAEAILDEWKAGAATEDSFAALANEKSDDAAGDNGGLYANVYPGLTVEAFEDWCFDNRKPGDTGIIETDYGYHVMYYSGASETTYRDHLISSELATNDYNVWYTDLLESVTATEHDFKYISMDLVLYNS